MFTKARSRQQHVVFGEEFCARPLLRLASTKTGELDLMSRACVNLFPFFHYCKMFSTVLRSRRSQRRAIKLPLMRLFDRVNCR